MKIVTKHYGNTLEGDKKYLIYLMNENNQPISCTDVIGEKGKSLAEHDLLSNNEIDDVETHSLNRFIQENNLSITQDGNPLILVFYLDRELMSQPEIIAPFSEVINDTLANRDANAMAFFIPTDGNERIECINPQIINQDVQDKVDFMIKEITEQFDIGTKEDDITLTTVEDID